MIAVAAEHAGLDPAVLAAAEHHKGVLGRLIDALIASPAPNEGYIGGGAQREYYGEDAPPQTAIPAESLRRFIQDAIVEIACRGQVVIVAHAASLALAGKADALRPWRPSPPSRRRSSGSRLRRRRPPGHRCIRAPAERQSAPAAVFAKRRTHGLISPPRVQMCVPRFPGVR